MSAGNGQGLIGKKRAISVEPALVPCNPVKLPSASFSRISSRPRECSFGKAQNVSQPSLQGR